MIIKVINNDLEAFIQSVESALPIDAKVLAFKNDDPEGSKCFWDRKKSRQFVLLNWYLALGGFFPTELRTALESGKVARCGKVPAWVEDEEDGLNIPEFDDILDLNNTEPLHDLHVIGDLSKSEYFAAADNNTLSRFKGRYNIKEWTVTKIFNHRLEEAEVTQQELYNFLENIGAEFIEEENRWSYLFKTYSEVTLEWDETNNTYILSVNEDEKELRRFLHLNGLVLANQPHKVALLILGYLLSSFQETDLTGRHAFLSEVYVDEVYVGFTHDILEQFRRNKCGTLGLHISEKNFLPTIENRKDYVLAASDYQSLGYSVFMHKGAKYIVVEAECCGFARIENETFVAWYADKEAKLTGRNLFSVATAAEYID